MINGVDDHDYIIELKPDEVKKMSKKTSKLKKFNSKDNWPYFLDEVSLDYDGHPTYIKTDHCALRLYKLGNDILRSDLSKKLKKTRKEESQESSSEWGSRSKSKTESKEKKKKGFLGKITSFLTGISNLGDLKELEISLEELRDYHSEVEEQLEGMKILSWKVYNKNMNFWNNEKIGVGRNLVRERKNILNDLIKVKEEFEEI